MERHILVVENLKKYFKATKAVDDISFKVERGSFFAFLGQNGAGKSTTINCIITLLKKDSGTILMDDQKDEDYIRNHIGVVFQENVLDDYLSVKENLLTRASLYFSSKEKLFERYQVLLVQLKLQSIENQMFKTLSGGQKRRVEIARALLSKPKLLILDEPTTGLDPETRRLVWDFIHKLKEDEDLTIFLTTHYMEEAAQADHIVIIDQGKISASGTPAQLKEAYSDDLLKLVPLDVETLLSYFTTNKIHYKIRGKQYIVKVDSTQHALSLIDDLKNNMDWFEVVHGTMDDVFLKVVGGSDV